MKNQTNNLLIYIVSTIIVFYSMKNDLKTKGLIKINQSSLRKLTSFYNHVEIEKVSIHHTKNINRAFLAFSRKTHLQYWRNQLT